MAATLARRGREARMPIASGSARVVSLGEEFMSRIAALTITCLMSSAAVIAASAQTAAPVDQAALEKSFDAGVKPDEMMAWNKSMASEPNNVGSPHDKANAEFELAQFQKFGWDAHIETFSVLYPTPIHEEVTLLGPKPFKAT